MHGPVASSSGRQIASHSVSKREASKRGHAAIYPSAVKSDLLLKSPLPFDILPWDSDEIRFDTDNSFEPSTSMSPMPLKDAVRALHSMATSHPGRRGDSAVRKLAPLSIEEQWRQKMLLHDLEIQIGAMVPHQMNMVVYSLATLSLHPGTSFMAKLRQRSLSRVAKFNPRELSTVIWGFAGIELMRRDLARLARRDVIEWTDAWLMASTKSLPDFTARDICQVLGALCTLGHPLTDAREVWTSSSIKRFKSILGLAAHNQATLAPRDISGTLLSLSSLTTLSDKWWINQALTFLHHSSHPGLLSPRDAAETLMAVSRLSHKPSPQMVHFLATSASLPPQPHRRRDFCSLSRLHAVSQSLRLLANTSWALSRLRYNAHPTLMSQIMSSSSLALDEVESILNEMDGDSVDHPSKVQQEILHATGHSLSLLVWSMGKLGWLWPSPPSSSSSSSSITSSTFFLSSVARASSSLANSSEAMSSQSIALLLYVFAKADHRPSPLTLSLLLDALLTSPAEEISPQAASMTLLSIGRLGFQPCDEWTESFVRLVMPILTSKEQKGSQEWIGIVKGLKLAGYRTNNSFLDQVRAELL
jgi:hypothetical protein